MAHTCAWTGEEFTGKGYVLKTTEGSEVVSEAAFRHLHLGDRVSALEDVLAEPDADSMPDPGE